jgi:glycosyltransferase involved in cell wall biosynthesis
MATAGTATPHVFMSAGPLYLENSAIRLLERSLCRLDSHLICSSGALYRAYRELGLPRERLSLIPYTVDSTWGPPAGDVERAAARRTLGLDADAFVAVCVAYFYAPKRLVHRGRGIKGHDVLLDGWEEYRRRGGQGVLLLVGGGFGNRGEAYRADLRARYAAVPAVKWVETVEDVRPYYLAADVSVTPSLSDNLGAPAEAAALGVPSVASDVGGLPEIVVDGWTGWLVTAGDPDDLASALEAARELGAVERRRFGERSVLRAKELLDRQRNGDAFAAVVERAVSQVSA